MNKTALKNFAVWARNKLIADITYKAGLMGITEAGIKTALPQSTKDTEFYDIGTKEPYLVGGEAVKQRRRLVELINGKTVSSNYKTAFHSVIEEVAYTWFNRLIAVRFMEVNDYLPSHIRVLSSESADKLEPDLVTTPFDADLELTETERAEVIRLKNENQVDALFRMLFIKQCNELNGYKDSGEPNNSSVKLPKLFEKTKDYSELLLNVSVTDQDGVVYHLVHDISEDDFKQAVEIIGWLYQYYNDERKNEVINIYKGTVKKEDIPAATQLFTTDWVVRYMVDNSLGRYWIERNPQSKLAEKLEFFVTPKDGHIAYVDEKIEPTELTFFDPCMGSGHILVYAFDVLMEIYRECGYSDRDAAESILQNNLYGLDIDNRAYQIAYFAVMMRARRYDRRALTKGLHPHIYPLYESYKCNIENEDLQYLMDEFRGVQQYGSLIDLKRDLNLDRLQQKIESIGGQLSIGMVDIPVATNIIKVARVLMNQYCVVCTNPPYLNKMNPVLKDYILKHYKDYSSDLFSVFMYKNFDYCKVGGYSAFMTPFVWMFIKTYEPLRKFIVENKSITTLVQMEYSAFEEATVPICSFVLKNGKSIEKGLYFKLSDFKGGMEIQKQKVLEAIANKDCGYFYEASTENLSKIPSMPIAYWASNRIIGDFEKGVQLGDLAEPCQGLATTNNDKFLRIWYEVFYSNIGFDCECEDNTIGRAKWFPFNKGGEFRKWYGNNAFIINFKNKGQELCDYIDATSNVNHTGRVINRDKYFIPNGTWSAITSGSLSVRYSPKGFIISNAGMAVYSNDYLFYIIAFLNCSIVTKILIKIINESINFNAGDIVRLPILLSASNISKVNEITQKAIDISKLDWDSFETSWDFECHPLVQLCHGVDAKGGHEIAYIEDSYNEWQFDCEQRFKELKSNEEELNRIFIDIYGLQDELTPEVADKDVTVARIYDTKEEIPESMKGNNYVLTKCDVIKSFLSYAVGCMFGRYSLNKPGLVFADGNFEKVYWKFKGQAACDENGDLPFGSNYAGISMAKYHYPKFRDSENWETATDLTFEPDVDNCIPITDEEYFEDDIVGRFVEFIKAVYGEETLEENLDFIANALGNKGNTSREVIRNYFLNDFFKDHCKTYKKRPIYWLFDSGKQNGFKALIYMHRYNENTVGNLRIDYLHRMERVYESEITRMQDTIDNSVNAREVTAATKRKEKLQKQIKECKEYDEKIAHLALARIAIDLDDGVKVNYEKVQTDTDGKLYQVLAKI